LASIIALEKVWGPIRRQTGSATRRAFAGGRFGVKGKIATVPSGPLKKPPNGASTHENGSHPRISGVTPDLKCAR
jgi:hypothetical protein